MSGYLVLSAAEKESRKLFFTEINLKSLHVAGPGTAVLQRSLNFMLYQYADL